jgi:hypothetical protein
VWLDRLKGGANQFLSAPQARTCRTVKSPHRDSPVPSPREAGKGWPRAGRGDQSIISLSIVNCLFSSISFSGRVPGGGRLRGALCFGLVLPSVPSLPTPVFSIAIPMVRPLEISYADSPVTGGQAIEEPSLSARSSGRRVETVQSSIKLKPSPYSITPERGSRSRYLIMIWVFGSICGTMRLICLQIELSRLRNAAKLAGPGLQKLPREIQLGLGATIPAMISLCRSGSPAHLRTFAATGLGFAGDRRGVKPDICLILRLAP